MVCMKIAGLNVLLMNICFHGVHQSLSLVNRLPFNDFLSAEDMGVTK